MKPKRITRWPRKKIPENALFIGPQSPYANHFKVQRNPGGVYTIENEKLNWSGRLTYQSKKDAKKVATSLFIFFFHKQYKTEEEIQEFLAPIRGKNLCDWCKLNESCHLDHLIYLANRG